VIKADYATYEKILPGWVNSFNSVCMLSAWPEQWELIRRLFPNAHVCNMDSVRWNLNNPLKEEPFDLIVAMNVFMYSTDPDLWFKHVKAACKELWLQDVIARTRSSTPGCELGSDEDKMRYTYPPKVSTSFVGAYDLNKQPISDFHLYLDPETDSAHPAIHFLARIRGDLC
jgi:hypothetical protein